MRLKTLRKERSRESNLPLKVRAHRNGVVQNDIALALKGGGQTTTIPVQYGDETFLNVPSVALEDVPTVAHRAQSQMQDVLEAITGNHPKDVNPF